MKTKEIKKKHFTQLLHCCVARDLASGSPQGRISCFGSITKIPFRFCESEFTIYLCKTLRKFVCKTNVLFGYFETFKF